MQLVKESFSVKESLSCRVLNLLHSAMHVVPAIPLPHEVVFVIEFLHYESQNISDLRPAPQEIHVPAVVVGQEQYMVIFSYFHVVVVGDVSVLGPDVTHLLVRMVQHRPPTCGRYVRQQSIILNFEISCGPAVPPVISIWEPVKPYWLSIFVYDQKVLVHRYVRVAERGNHDETVGRLPLDWRHQHIDSRIVLRERFVGLDDPLLGGCCRILGQG
mmetsp:Transcript_50822/g.127523  ORF Transcript_50822/g.127523 Transcript_50822/m.127523 type:complete len:215 (-) Transcript_50822:656-1300(-)